VADNDCSNSVHHSIKLYIHFHDVSVQINEFYRKFITKIVTIPVWHIPLQKALKGKLIVTIPYKISFNSGITHICDIADSRNVKIRYAGNLKKHHFLRSAAYYLP